MSNAQISAAFGVLTATYILYSSYYISRGLGSFNTIISVISFF